MTTSLLNDIKTQLTPDMVQHLSSLLGESPANTQKAVDQVLPTLLASVMHLSSSSDDGPTRLVNLINHRNYERLLNNLSGLFDKGNTVKILIASGRDILSTLFAGKLSAVSTLIANDNGVTNASASSLLSLTAPLVVGTLGRARAAQGLNAVGLTTLLLNQTTEDSYTSSLAVEFLPFGLSVAERRRRPPDSRSACSSTSPLARLRLERTASVFSKSFTRTNVL